MNSQTIIGDRVRRLRTALALSQAELAASVGLSTGSISMLENGRFPVDGATLDSLATALECAPAYFASVTSEFGYSKPLLRAYADAPSKFVDRSVADSITAVHFINELDLPTVADVLPLFDGDVNNDESIEEFAHVVRAHAKLDATDVVGNAIRAAERLGCIVLPLESELGRHLGMSMRVDGKAVLRVSRPTAGPHNSVPGDRQRFTVAHELGHLVLHQDSPPPATSVEANRVEKQAHRFASAFLAPAEPLLADLQAHGGRVTLGTMAELKQIWGVSIKALVIRFRQLSVIDDDQARSLYKQISSRRWNTVEPVPVGNESAVWLSRAIQKKLFAIPDAVATASKKSGLGSSYITRWVDWSPLSGSSDSNVTRLEPSAVRERPMSGKLGRGLAHFPVQARSTTMDF